MELKFVHFLYFLFFYFLKYLLILYHYLFLFFQIIVWRKLFNPTKNTSDERIIRWKYGYSKPKAYQIRKSAYPIKSFRWICENMVGGKIDLKLNIFLGIIASYGLTKRYTRRHRQNRNLICASGENISNFSVYRRWTWSILIYAEKAIERENVIRVFLSVSCSV